MPIIRVQVENADELLNASMLGAGALGRVERAATESGTYSEISTFALVSGTRLYTVYDAAGAETSWYRVRYSKSDGSSPSSYGVAFAAGDETGGLLCSLYDVSQRMFGSATVSNSDQEVLLDIIRGVSADIEGYTGRWLAPRPAATRVYDTSYGYYVALPKGIRDVTAIAYATTDQPTTGGTYTTLTDYALQPADMDRDPGWPATSICTRRTLFRDAWNALQITSTAGFSAVPYDIQEVAIGAVTRRFSGKQWATPAVSLGPDGGVRILRDIGPDGTRTLERYRRIVSA